MVHFTRNLLGILGVLILACGTSFATQYNFIHPGFITAENAGPNRLGILWIGGKFETAEVVKLPECEAPVIHLKDTNYGDSNDEIAISFFGNSSEMTQLRGKRLSFSARIKQVSGNQAGLLATVNLKNKKQLSSVETLPVNLGQWQELKLFIDVPKDADNCVFRFASGWGWRTVGEAYFTDLKLVIIGNAEEPAKESEEKPAAAEHVFYRDEVPSLWAIYGDDFHVSEHSEAAYSGRRGLSLLTVKDCVNPVLKVDCNRGTPASQRWCFVNRDLDLKDFSGGMLKIVLKPFRPIAVDGKTFGPEYAKKTIRGFYIVRIPLSALPGLDKNKNLWRFSFSFPGRMKAGEKTFLGEMTLESHDPKAKIAYSWYSTEARDLLAREAQIIPPVRTDEYEAQRPLIKDGTFYRNGHYQHFTGVCLGYTDIEHDFSTQFSSPRDLPGFPEYYFKPINRQLAEEVGLSALHWGNPTELLTYIKDISMRYPFTLGQGFEENLKGLPVFIDSGSLSGLCNQFKIDKKWKNEYEVDASARAVFKEFVPFCPENPEMNRFYKDLWRYGISYNLRHKLNTFAYELFNESGYSCGCESNRARFQKYLEQKYGSIDHANQVWNDHQKDFYTAARLTQLNEYPGIWVDWNKFSADRYVEVLKEMKAAIREVDQRPRTYFTEQCLLTNLLDFNGGSMDYRKICGALDFLAGEGGYSFGEKAQQTNNPMVAALEGSSSRYILLMDIFTAIARRDNKPVINNEHYNQRRYFGLRIPSRRSDIPTSLWGSVFHGSSSDMLYTWGGRNYDWHNYEEARQSVLEAEKIPGGTYKGGYMLNPYNYPPEALKGFKDFEAEMRILADVALPMPRLKRPVIALVYSYPTLRLSGIPPRQDMTNLRKYHTALLLLHYPFEMLMEEDISAKTLAKYEAVVLPCNRNSYSETIPAVKEYVKRGGRLLFADDAFLEDEYGKKLPTDSLFREKKSGTSFGAGKLWSFDRNLPANRLSEELRKIFKSERISRYVALETADGKPFPETEVQIIDRGSRKLLLVINLNDGKPVLGRLQVFCGENGSSVTEVSARKRYLNGSGSEKWSAAELAAGIGLVVPPQERRLFLIETEPSLIKEVKPCSQADVAAELTEALSRPDPAEAEKARIRKALHLTFIPPEFKGVTPAKCRPLVLKPCFNRKFSDEKAGDGRGGAFDQGSWNDMRQIPIGEVLCAGVPFWVADEKKGNSLLVMYGEKYNPSGVKSVELPMKGTIKNFYVLHSTGWSETPGFEVMKYIFHYQDGSEAVIPIHFGEEIDGWWELKRQLPNAKIGLRFANSLCESVGFFAFRAANPHPEKPVKNLEIISLAMDSVPAVAAVTVED